MVFRRRDKLKWWQMAAEGVWPRAGWSRVITYFSHRIRRLPDTPHKVARGMFAGTLVSMLPLPGLQIVLGGLLAWGIRGNILAAVLCSFISNPVTTPFIALASITIGQWVMGKEGVLSVAQIGNAFAEAGADLWHNLKALFTEDTVVWVGFLKFLEVIFLPYFVGALVVGLISGIIAYYVTLPLVGAYQKARARRLRDRIERRLARRADLPAGEEQTDPAGDAGRAAQAAGQNEGEGS